MGRSWTDIHFDNGVFEHFGFNVYVFCGLHAICLKQSNAKHILRYLVYRFHWRFNRFIDCYQYSVLYTYTGWGRHCSFRQFW